MGRRTLQTYPSDNNSRMDIINQTTQRLHLDMARLDEIIKRFESQCRSYSSDNVVMEFRRTGEENTFFISWRMSSPASDN